mgnify:CR=1 FL=1
MLKHFSAPAGSSQHDFANGKRINIYKSVGDRAQKEPKKSVFAIGWSLIQQSVSQTHER